jgi:uncharacterized protein YqeY
MSLKEQITNDMKSAMRAKDASKLGTIRLILAEIKRKEVDERQEMTDTAILSLIEKMIKQRKDSISQFVAGNRQDLAAIEQAELEILGAYMPAMMSEAEVKAEVDSAVAAVRAETPGAQAMGKVMGILKPKLAGKADMTMVSALVKQALAA